MGKYKDLLRNTVIFAIGSFSSKVLAFVMLPFYSNLLTKGDYGTVDLIVNTCTLIVPLVSLSIHEAVIRFGLDESTRKSDVFSSAVLMLLCGYAVLLACSPLLKLISFINNYIILVCVYVITSALRSTVSQFVRATGYVRLFALDGLATTFVTIGLQMLFLIVFKMGVTGYVLAIICADAFSSITLTIVMKLYRFIHLRRFSRETLGAMLRYSIPLMPTAIFWWVTNLSDRYFIAYMVDVGTNGLYSMASKFPAMITLVSLIFTQAWQISAFSSNNDGEQSKFFSTVFRSYYVFVFLAASGIILLAKPVIHILNKEYHDAWIYVPFLVLAVSFSCLVTFLGSVYNVAKKNLMVGVTTCVGAVLNIVLNSLMIPIWGAQGAAIATFISYLAVFIFRAIDTQRYLPIRMQPARLAAGALLLLLQAVVSICQVRWGTLIQVAILLLLTLCNLGPIIAMLQQIRRAFSSRFGQTKKA